MMKKWAVLLGLCVMSVSLHALTIDGAGASFPNAFYKVAFKTYQSERDVTVNYEPVGSGYGLTLLKEKKVDFAGSDIIPGVEERKEHIFIPSVVGGVAIVYNLPGNPKVKLTPEILVEIFTGKITKWNDKKIKGINKYIELPDLEIRPFHRNGTSGTTKILETYFTKFDKKWIKKRFKGKNNTAMDSNSDLMKAISATEGGLGYTSFTNAKEAGLTYAALQNKSGLYVFPSPESIRQAAIFGDRAQTYDLTHQAGETSYPIAGISWIILPKELRDSVSNFDEAKGLTDFIWWVTHTAQIYAAEFGFAPLPVAYVKESDRQLGKILFDDILVR